MRELIKASLERLLQIRRRVSQIVSRNILVQNLPVRFHRLEQLLTTRNIERVRRVVDLELSPSCLSFTLFNLTSLRCRLTFFNRPATFYCDNF